MVPQEQVAILSAVAVPAVEADDAPFARSFRSLVTGRGELRMRFAAEWAYWFETTGGAPMELSSRNQLKATIKAVTLGNIMAEVVMELDGGQEIVAAITRGSAEHLELKPGDQVTAIIKATEVMIGK